MTPRLVPALILASLGPLTTAACANVDPEPGVAAAATQDPLPSPLPLPTTLPEAEYEELLYPFIRSRKYAGDLHWVRDKGVRDTGPWVDNTYYGTHPAVRIYYSPRVMYWLTGDPAQWPEGAKAGLAPAKAPREGAVPDGGMIVKEMFAPPAVRYEGLSDARLVAILEGPDSAGWTVMVKDAAGSKDGWFWSAVFHGEEPDTGAYPYSYPNSGFGLYCLNCHAVAESESTFSALRNVEGFPGEPLHFFYDDSWRTPPKGGMQELYFPHLKGRLQQPGARAFAGPNEEFLRTFDSMPPVPYRDVLKFPSESLDHVVASPEGAEQFLTSDQCMSCHAGGSTTDGPFGPVMVILTGKDDQKALNVSPYGEWRWSPMGLAGRDPVFHAQLESELAILKAEFPPAEAEHFGAQTVNTCLLCHGAMGKRQLDIDRGVGDAYWDEKASFELDWFYVSDPADPHAKYGALGRDGISCTVCHHTEAEYKGIAEFLENSITGQYALTAADVLLGPFGADPSKGDPIATLPMEHALGVKPEYNAYVKSSRLCGSCHTIDLPVVDYPLADPPKLDCDVKPDPELNKPDKNPNFAGFMHKIEQATYLEWLNSAFQDEFAPSGPDAKSCQDCHMPGGYHGLDGEVSVDPIQTKIAFIEDQSYPDVDHRAPTDEITVTYREEGYARHTFQGLNVFMAEMFRQFNDVLGVRLTNYMTGTEDLDFAISNFVENARRSTATLEVTRFEVTGGVLEADVRVTNLTGHRLPSGVGFRRVFLEFLVLSEQGGRETAIWASGRSSEVGVLVGPDGESLPTEFLTDGRYQQHWETIEREDQVQIYEELSKNAAGQFTTSFIHRDCEVKDNRLLPRGWSAKGPSPQIPPAFIEATHPGSVSAADPQYRDGSGTDVVTYRVKLPPGTDTESLRVSATLYSQAWAPYYLNQRFTDVAPGPEGDARRRLYYLASHLALEGTPIEGWKLALASASASGSE